MQVHRKGKELEEERRGLIAVVIGNSQRDRWKLERRGRRKKGPMICRQRQEKRSVKIVVQHLSRPTEKNPSSQVQTLFLILTYVSVASCKILCLHSFCKYSWAVLAAITQPVHKHKSSFEFWKCKAQLFGLSCYHWMLFAVRQLAW